MRLSRLHRTFALGLALVPALFPLAAQAPTAEAQAAASAGNRDYAALIGDFPRPGSDAAKADQAILLWLQTTRTEEEVRRAQCEAHIHLGVFSRTAGVDLESPRFPLTQALAEDLRQAMSGVTGKLKLQFNRPRPYLAIPELKPALPLEPSRSYPSGHSAWGMVEANLLAALDPGRREAFLVRGRLVGYDRVLGGVHYPSDVQAGLRLGQAFAEAWLAMPANRQRVEQARTAEWSLLKDAPLIGQSAAAGD
jgi:acid phosphatase (class A)